MARHRYPASTLVGDYARAGLGLVCTGAPLMLGSINPWIAGAFGVLAVLFAAFGGSTALRQLRTVAVDQDAIALEGPLPRRLDWAALEALSLRYFAVKSGKGGWMQLVLRAGWRRIAIDSRIDGFAEIAALAAAAAQRRGIAFGEATLANLAALGIAAESGRAD